MNSLFSIILLSDKVLLLFRGEVEPPQLVFADPDDCFIAACKLFLVNSERDLRVLLGDGVAVVTVHDQAPPYDDGIDDAAISQDVGFERV